MMTTVRLEVAEPRGESLICALLCDGHKYSELWLTLVPLTAYGHCVNASIFPSFPTYVANFDSTEQTQAV